MRKIKYKILPGSGDGTIPAEKNLLQFVQDIPYVLTFNLIPPLKVLNDIFKRGYEDAGMSGGIEWQPFELDEKEYRELVRVLKNNHKTVDTPDWVKTKSDWTIWASEYELGIPSKKHQKLWKDHDQWEKLKRIARDKGDEELAMKYHLKAVKSGNKLAKFIEPYIRKYHNK